MSGSLLIFGEALVDLFPGAAVPGGAPFNVARHLAAFGSRPLLLTRLGKDAEGALLRAEMARCGLSLAATQEDAGHATGKVLVQEKAPGHHHFHIEEESAYDFIDAGEFARGPWKPDEFGWIYGGTLALRKPVSGASYSRLLADFPARRYVDLNWRARHTGEDLAWQTLCGAEVAKLNEDELRMVLGWRGLDTAIPGLPPATGKTDLHVAALLGMTRIRLLVVTYGASGYAAFDSKGSCLSSGPGLPNTPIRDTVGAGDAFSAVTLLGLSRGWPLAITLARANRFAAAICGVRGAVPEHADFYETWKKEWQIAILQGNQEPS